MAPPTSPNPAYLVARQIQQINDAKHTLSSWDNCMAKAYCKWPVIVVIIVGALIILSILFCVFRCLCCGLECCCGICKCCNACCPSPRNKQQDHKYSQPPPGPFYQPQPQPYAPMMYGGAAPAAAPQYASYDSSGKSHNAGVVGGKTNADSLPAMPSWSNARERHVEDDTPLEDIPLEEQKPLVKDAAAAEKSESELGRAESPPPLGPGPGAVPGAGPGAGAGAGSGYGGAAAAMGAGALAGGAAAGYAGARRPNRYQHDHNDPYNTSKRYNDTDSEYADSAYISNPYGQHSQNSSRSYHPGGQYAHELDSQAPSSPTTVSSMYTANPPPSYRTNPPPRSMTGGSNPRYGPAAAAAGVGNYSRGYGPNNGGGMRSPPPGQGGRGSPYSPGPRGSPYGPPASQSPSPPQQQQQQSYQAYQPVAEMPAQSDYASSSPGGYGRGPASSSTRYEPSTQEAWHSSRTQQAPTEMPAYPAQSYDSRPQPSADPSARRPVNGSWREV